MESESSAPAKQALDPTEMMLGCHKDADNQLYRGYNDAEYDELAAWTRKLPDNETLFFFGGYGEGGRDATRSPEARPESWAGVVKYTFYGYICFF